MSYDTAIAELRQFLSDNEFNKRVTKKKLIGKVDAVNTVFFTYDKRLFADTVEVYVNDSLVDADVNDPIKGQLTLAAPPDKNSAVQASYYWQWWLDDELINFLNKGAEAVSQVDVTPPDTAYLQIPSGLKLAALMLACSLATRALIQYMVNRRHSEEFLIEEDGNDDNKFSQTIAAMQKVADGYWKDGISKRDDFYKRDGKRNAPAFAIKVGKVRNYGPRR